MVFCVCVHIPFGCLGTWYFPTWAQGVGLKAHEIGEERWDKPFTMLRKGFPPNGNRSDLEMTREDIPV